MEWMYGATTVPGRRDTLLPTTLASLAEAGFSRPRLFVDGTRSGEGYGDHDVTPRWPAVGAYGNWLLGLWELYLRNPLADRYAMFEDDLLACRNLRAYLERCAFPAKGYLNLYTVDQHIAVLARPRGWHRADCEAEAQNGKGALGLVFDRAGVQAMLTQQYLVGHPHNRKRGRENTDGAVWYAMNNAGIREWVHNPSLLQHAGDESVLNHRTVRRAASFSADYDPLEPAQ